MDLFHPRLLVVLVDQWLPEDQMHPVVLSRLWLQLVLWVLPGLGSHWVLYHL